MGILFALKAVVAGLSAASSSFASARDEPASPDVAAEDTVDISFDRDRYERMTVPVIVDGMGPYRFFIDTGAQATVVTERIKSDLGMEPAGRALLVALGSSRSVETLFIDRLEFADRTLSGLTSPLLERRHVGADGILGLDTLQDMRVVIDFRADRMSVSNAERAGGTSEYEIIVKARSKLGQMIITDARIDGVRTAVIIDTGAQNTIGNEALRQRLRRRGSETFSSTDVHGTTITGEVAFVRKLEIGRMTLSGLPIGFAQSPAVAALGYEDKPALILGIGNLSLFDRVAIDFASRRVLFDVPADASVPPGMGVERFFDRLRP